METQIIDQSQNQKTKKEKFERSFSAVEKQCSKLDFVKLLDNITKSEIDSRDFIIKSIDEKLDPKSDKIQNFNLRSRNMRKIGNRFLNLFRITFTIEFAGVMLVNFTIPKITDDEKQL